MPELPTGTESHEDSWIRSLSINVLIPLALLAVSIAVLLILGEVENEQLPPADNSREGRLRALPSVRIERVQSLQSTGAQLQLKVDGTVVPYREARIATEVAGRIVYKSDQCETGCFVKTGQLLMRIDATDYELEVQRNTRLREQEYQAISEVDQEMANTKRLIEVASQDVDLQQKEVDRQKSLPEGFASPAEIDRAQRTLLQATQQLITSQNQLSLLLTRRVRLEASERLAATQLKLAEVNLARTEIRAPIDGVIVSESAEMNAYVSRGNTLITIEDTSKVEVAMSLRMDQWYWILDQKRHSVDESSRGYELPETPAFIEYELSGRQGVVYRWNGRLLRYDGIGLDRITRTVPVRVIVDNPQQYIDDRGNVKEAMGPTALVRGMYVTVKLLIQPQTPLVVVPARALKPGNRVWQFVPDETVLEVDKVDGGETDAGKTPLSEAAVVEADGSEDNPTEQAHPSGKFDADAWRPGRVVVRESVIPVDSLSLGSDPNVHAESSFSRHAESRRWVCEDRNQLLVDGSFVAVSPLGFTQAAGIAARASTKTITQHHPDVTIETAKQTRVDRPTAESVQ